MLNDRDSLGKFKALEGINILTNNANLSSEQLASILPPKDQDKELLKKLKEQKSEPAKSSNFYNFSKLTNLKS